MLEELEHARQAARDADAVRREAERDMAAAQEVRRAEKSAVDTAVEEAIRGIDPIAFAPKNVRVEAWSEAFVELRVPACIKEGADVQCVDADGRCVTWGWGAYGQ